MEMIGLRKQLVITYDGKLPEHELFKRPAVDRLRFLLPGK